MIIKRQTNKDLKKECDRLWRLCIRKRAGNKSELSGRTEVLQCHHLRGKPNLLLRYSLDNGFCCTKGEHFYGFHHTGRRASYEERVKILRGKDIFDKLEAMKNINAKQDLNLIKITLEMELKGYGNIWNFRKNYWNN